MWFNHITDLAEDFLSLFYPQVCAACHADLRKGMKVLCAFCTYKLPRTGFHDLPGNLVENHFLGKARIESATAFYHFSKGERVQRLVHLLKYNGRQDIGLYIGELLGAELHDAKRFATVDVVVPVPLHPDRLRKRGYNQAACLSEGIAKGMQVQHLPEALIRNKATDTQTRKHRFERFRNVDQIFAIHPDVRLQNRHVLLVDDVLTTGSTLASCAETLLAVPGVKVSIAAMATA